MSASSRHGPHKIDALPSLTGFSLVGGPAYNDSHAAAETLGSLDVPYVAAQALEFQTIEQWEDSERGLSPVEATMMVAIPELDGATAPMVFGGRGAGAAADRMRDIQPHRERVERLADRVERLVRLRHTNAPSASSPSCCSISRPTAARPAPRRSSASTPRCTTRCSALARRL